jgi:hypothetical protein
VETARCSCDPQLDPHGVDKLCLIHGHEDPDPDPDPEPVCPSGIPRSACCGLPGACGDC